MRLSAVVAHVHREHETFKPFVLADGEHVVSHETAQALAHLAQAIAVHGLEDVQDRQSDLFVAVARTLLKPDHPGWTKWVSSKHPAETVPPVDPPLTARDFATPSAEELAAAAPAPVEQAAVAPPAPEPVVQAPTPEPVVTPEATTPPVTEAPPAVPV